MTQPNLTPHDLIERAIIAASDIDAERRNALSVCRQLWSALDADTNADGKYDSPAVERYRRAVMIGDNHVRKS